MKQNDDTSKETNKEASLFTFSKNVKHTSMAVFVYATIIQIGSPQNKE